MDEPVRAAATLRKLRRALAAAARGDVVGERGEDVEKVEVLHPRRLAQLRRHESLPLQLLHQFLPLRGVEPARAEVRERRHERDEFGDKPRLVFLRRDTLHFPVDAEQVEIARVSDVDFHSAHFHARRRRRWWRLRTFGRLGRRGRHDEVRAEKRRRAGVIEDAEDELAAAFVDARAAPNHLVKKDRRMQVAEENDVPHTRHIHAGREQVLRRGDEVRTLPPAKIRDERLPIHRRHALESVSRHALVPLRAAPCGVKVVERIRHEVRVMIARAKDDRLLQRIVLRRHQQAREKMFAHRLHPLGQDEPRLQRPALAFLRDHIRRHALPRERVGEPLIRHIGPIHAAHALGLLTVVVEDVVLLDVSGREVAILDALRVGILVSRFAEVFVVVRQSAPIFLDALLRVFVVDFLRANLPWCGGEADLDRVVIALQNRVPFAPRRAVAFVDHDHIEETGRVMLEEKRQVFAPLWKSSV